MRQQPEPARHTFLGIEGGATHTVAILSDAAGGLLRKLESGPANLQFLSDSQLVSHFGEIAQAIPFPDAVGIGLAGAWHEADQQKIRRAAAQVWPGVPCYATHDLETAHTAAEVVVNGGWEARVLIVSGTGSACYGKRANGLQEKVGGWGHVLGDRGSGYDIGLRALQGVISYYDRHETWPKLGQRILGAVQLNEPRDLIAWAQAASKGEIASLAIEVFESWNDKDLLASAILREAGRELAQEAATCARRIARAGKPVHFVLTGSVLLKSSRFAKQLGREVRRMWPEAAVTPLAREGAWGAVELARQLVQQGANPARLPRRSRQRAPEEPELVRSTRLSPTEERHPGSMNLDKMKLKESIALMLEEDATIPRKLLALSPALEKTVRAIAGSFRQGGRLFYIGAGTSGRLGVLDASECPPTFRTDPEQVQGIVAGGQVALWSSVEGAEDDRSAGQRAIACRAVTRHDVVVGIAASGTTPFVWGGLREAKRRKATTVLLCFNPYLEIPAVLRPDIVLAPNLGPELLTGSTRLKAGTATKLVLNLLTTLAMVQVGKVMSNLMIDLHPANVKLRDRAVRIVQALTAVSHEKARAALEGCGWVIKTAVGNLRQT